MKKKYVRVKFVLQDLEYLFMKKFMINLFKEQENLQLKELNKLEIQLMRFI